MKDASIIGFPGGFTIFFLRALRASVFPIPRNSTSVSIDNPTNTIHESFLMEVDQQAKTKVQ
jgi:hypothetical protein